jgi:molybdenum cofactor guanylyltransferase
VVVVCKRATVLPPLPRVDRWNEPDAPRHPLTGIVQALERARGSVLVCAADMPFVTADACRALVDAAVAVGLLGGERGAGDIAPAGVVAETPSGLEPLLALYGRPALGRLRAASAGAPLRAAVEALDPVRVLVPGSVVRSINTQDDLAAAEAQLAPAR